MKKRSLLIILGLLVCAVGIFPAGCQFSSANIKDATMAVAVDDETAQPTERTDKYRMWMPTFTCAVYLSNAPSDTKLKALWLRNVDGTYQPLDSLEQSYESDGWKVFTLTRSGTRWGYGEYKVDLYLNGTLDRSIPFTVVPTYENAPLSEIILTNGGSEDGSPRFPVSVFPATADPIYLYIHAYEPQEATKYGVVWYQQLEEGIAPITSSELIHDKTGWLSFSMVPGEPLPVGKYLAEVVINDEPFTNLEFSVE